MINELTEELMGILNTDHDENTITWEEFKSFMDKALSK